MKIGLSAPFPVVDTLRCYVVPKDRDGARKPLDPLFTKLTGITEEDIDNEGMDLAQALDRTQQFAAGEKLWSWGKDEFNLIAISCYVEGIAPPIPVSQFGNACNLLLKAGMPYADLQKARSNTLSQYYQIEHPPLRGHDALDDALSVAYVLQHLLQQGALTPSDLA